MNGIRPAFHRLLLMSEAAFLLFIIVALKRIGRTWMVRRALKPDDSGRPVPFSAGRSVSRAVQRACARLPFYCSSLDRGLAGWLMIRRRGYGGSIDMRILDAEPGEFKAYANLISGGEVIIGRKEPGDFRYEEQ